MCQWGRRFLTDAYNKHAKTKECLNHNIYIKIDDSVRICNDCIEKRITTILMDIPYIGYHGIQEGRTIWNIAVVAYMINRKWFMKKEISCPNIKQDTSYELTTNKHNISIVTKLDRNKIYKDLFEKFGE